MGSNSSDDKIKIFSLAPLIGITSSRSTSDKLRQLVDVIVFMASVSQEMMDEPIVGPVLFLEGRKVCAKALVEQHPVLEHLAREYIEFCTTFLTSHFSEYRMRLIDEWMITKTSELPPELRNGFPVKKLDKKLNFSQKTTPVQNYTAPIREEHETITRHHHHRRDRNL